MDESPDPLSRFPDAGLVAAAIAGDQTAFAVLISRYFGMVHAVAFARLGQRETAEDLAQEVFLQAYLRLADLREPRHFSAWITRITRNLAANWARDEQRRSRLAQTVPIDESAMEIADPQTGGGREEMVRREENELVREAVFQLDPEAREIVLLRFMEEKGVAEIGRQLGVHRITVRRHLKKALAALRRELEPMLGDAAPAWRPSKRAVARATALVAGATALSASGKSALAAAAIDAGAGATFAATQSVAALPAAGLGGLAQSTWAAAWTWLAGGGAIVTTGKAAAILAICGGLVVGVMRTNALRSAEPGAATSSEAMDVGQSQVSAPPVISLPPGEAHDILEKAEGYAALLNVEKTGELTEQVLAKNSDPRVRAAAFWVRAMAYTRCDLEYRMDTCDEKRRESVGKIAELQPSFLNDELPTWEVALQFHVPAPDAPRVEELVSQARASLADEAASDPVAAFRLGRSFQQAAIFYRLKGDTGKSGPYADEACRYMGDAAKRRPGCYEYQAYYLTALSEAGRHSEAEQLGERIAKQFAGKFPYPPAGDSGPLCLYVAAVSLSDPDRSMEILRQYAEQNPTDAWLQYKWTLEGTNAGPKSTSDPGEAVKDLSDLVRRMENGTITVRGTGLHAMASAYYKLAAAQANAEQFQEALATYEKLAALSPYYAMLHFNRAAIYFGMAQKELDPSAKQDLLQRALAEYLEQIRYNYHGTAAAEAQKACDRIQRELAPR